MAETRRKFDADFRQGAVRLVRETGKPIAQVARDLGINEGTLGSWVNADRRRRVEGSGSLSDGAVAVAALIAALREQHRLPAAVACRALGVSRSWYYKHRGGTLPPRAERRDRLKAEVNRLFAMHESKYGSPRLTADLRYVG